jgi:signal transduction histidine kinase
MLITQTDLMAVTGVAAFGAGTAGMLGWAVIRLLPRRSETLPLLLCALTVIAMAAGTLAVAHAMYLSEPDLRVVLVVLLTAAGVSLPTAWLVGRQAAAARQRSRSYEAARRELIAWVSEDLREPLSNLRDALDSLEHGDRLRPQVDRLAGLADDLLEISRS